MKALSQFVLVSSLVLTQFSSANADTTALQQAVQNPARTEANKARDPYRHPVDTLAFFGV